MKILMTVTTDYVVFYKIYDNPGERFFIMISLLFLHASAFNPAPFNLKAVTPTKQNK